MRFQCQGLGKQLTEAIFNHVRSRSPKKVKVNPCPQRVFLETTDSQPAAIKLYTRCGFEWIGLRPKTTGLPFPYSYFMHSTQYLAFKIEL